MLNSGSHPLYQLRRVMSFYSPEQPGCTPVKVLYDFNPEEETDIEVKENDIAIAFYCVNGWMMVSNDRGSHGYIPIDFCELLYPSKSEIPKAQKIKLLMRMQQHTAPSNASKNTYNLKNKTLTDISGRLKQNLDYSPEKSLQKRKQYISIPQMPITHENCGSINRLKEQRTYDVEKFAHRDSKQAKSRSFQNLLAIDLISKSEKLFPNNCKLDESVDDSCILDYQSMKRRQESFHSNPNPTAPVLAAGTYNTIDFKKPKSFLNLHTSKEKEEQLLNVEDSVNHKIRNGSKETEKNEQDSDYESYTSLNETSSNSAENSCSSNSSSLQKQKELLNKKKRIVRFSSEITYHTLTPNRNLAEKSNKKMSDSKITFCVDCVASSTGKCACCSNNAGKESKIISADADDVINVTKTSFINKDSKVEKDKESEGNYQEQSDGDLQDQLVQVLYTYKAREFGDLNVESGDVLLFKGIFDSDWCWLHSFRSNKSGYVPLKCIVPYFGADGQVV